MRKNLLSLAMAVMMMLSICPSAFAIEERQTAENGVVFSGLDQLAPGERIEYMVADPDGSKAVVGIEKVQTFARASGETWRVWYEGIGSSVEFYMTVSNNKVTSVYDYSITLVGRSYEDPVLTKTSTYGKLTFTLKSFTGSITGTCWLKGTVTGEDDQIEVSWRM